MDPLLIEVPQEIRTPRLYLRCPRPGDGAIVLPSVRLSLPELKPWMPWASDDYSLETAETWCRKNAAAFIARKELQFLIFSADQTEQLGSIGAFRINWDVPKGELGYWLRSDRTGRGLMSEAVAAVTQFFFDTLHFNRVEILTDDRNQRSWRVAERCGYLLEGTLRNEIRFGKTLRDTRVYARIAAQAAPGYA